MATDFRRILLRRGTGTPPTDLAAGELAFQTDTKKLFIGTGDASPNHYKQIANLADMGVTASETELNLLDGATISLDELNKLDGFTGTYEDLNYAKDLRATGVTTTEFDFLDGVTSNIQSQINGIVASEAEWIRCAEINPASNATITINQSLLGEAFANGSYDYKIVINASTDDRDTAGSLFIQLDDDSTAGRHSSVRSVTSMSQNETVTVAGGGELGDDGTTINTGLTLGSGGTAGQLGETYTGVTVLNAEFEIIRSQIMIGNTQIPSFVYAVKGNGAIIFGESGPGVDIDGTYSISKLSQFAGGYGAAPQNLTSVVIGGFPDAGTNDDLKIRVYKRQR
jgi:hypothetical protein